MAALLLPLVTGVGSARASALLPASLPPLGGSGFLVASPLAPSLRAAPLASLSAGPPALPALAFFFRPLVRAP
ncbi:acyl-CoA dehydrogenase, partial [Mycobacterium tuberculosis]